MRLLLAEDEKDLSRALITILKRNNYSADAVYDGEAALEYLETNNYDGLTVLKTIRAQGNPVPVLLLTAKSEIDDRVTGLDAGANDYLTKPFSFRELLARIRAMTRLQTIAASTTLQRGNLTLNPATFELSSPAGTVRLANKEFQIMEMLMNNPGSLISTERFMEHIWGYDSSTDISVVWVYISSLRRKLKALQASVLIKAARNAGYSLEEQP